VADDIAQQSASIACSVSSDQHFDRSDDEGYYNAVASPRSLSPECRSGKRLTVLFAESDHDGAKENEGFKKSQMNGEGPEYDRFAEEDAVDNWSETEDSEGWGSTLQSRWGEQVDATADEEFENDAIYGGRIQQLGWMNEDDVAGTAEGEGPGFCAESESGEDEGQDESFTEFHADVVCDQEEPYAFTTVENEPSDHDDYQDTEGVIADNANEGEYEVIDMDVSGSSGGEDDSEERSCRFHSEMLVGFQTICSQFHPIHKLFQDAMNGLSGHSDKEDGDVEHMRDASKGETSGVSGEKLMVGSSNYSLGLFYSCAVPGCHNPLPAIVPNRKL
jgi:hypothetical protein